MLDRERILIKIDELEGYIKEQRGILHEGYDYNDYIASIEKRRACERLLQISVECVIDICSLFISGLRLGLPSEESDVFDRLLKSKIVSEEMSEILKSMKGFRNILVHDYAGIDNAIVYEMATTRLQDFEKFIKEILSALKKYAGL